MYGGLASIDVPALVRIKPGAFDRLGVYCARRLVARGPQRRLAGGVGRTRAPGARRRRAIACRPPAAVILDTAVCFEARRRSDPLSRAEWRHALEIAPSMKQDFYAALSTRDVRDEVARLLDEDARLTRCFV